MKQDTKQDITIHVPAAQDITIIHGNLRVQIVPPATLSSITINGRPITLSDNSKAYDFLTNTKNPFQQLTEQDIGTTFWDKDGKPIGIYTGSATFRDCKRTFNLFAAITDARDSNNDRLYMSFNEYVSYLTNNPDGEKLVPKENTSYETLMKDRIKSLEAGEITGQMIPNLDMVKGKFSSSAMCLYEIKNTQGFNNNNNSGFDSRFMNPVDGKVPWYMTSSLEYNRNSGNYNAMIVSFKTGTKNNELDNNTNNGYLRAIRVVRCI